MKKFILLLFALIFVGCRDYHDIESIAKKEGFSQTCIDYAMPTIKSNSITNDAIIVITLQLEACKTRELLTEFHKENK
jgi:hypothetical protein